MREADDDYMGEIMQALVYHGPGKLVLERRPVPQPEYGQVLIKVRAVSICGSDLGAYRYGSDRFIPPLVLGHEFSGVIAGVGPGVCAWKEGQRVTVNPMLFCRECYYCNRDMGNLCGNRRSIGTTIGGAATHGAMQEYLVVPAWALIGLDERISFRAGAMLEPMGVCLACAKCGRTEGEETVVVIGAGPIGLLITKMLKAMEIPCVVVSDILPARLESALECGADLAVNAVEGNLEEQVLERTGGRGADRVLIAAGAGAVIPQSFKMIRHGGTVVLVAFAHGEVIIDPMEIVTRGLNLLGSYMFTNEMKEAAHWLAEGKIAVEHLVTRTLPLQEGAKAFEMLCAPNNKEIKVQLTMET